MSNLVIRAPLLNLQTILIMSSTFFFFFFFLGGGGGYESKAINRQITNWREKEWTRPKAISFDKCASMILGCW